MIKNNSKIFLAGHRGLVGSAIKRKLYEAGYRNIITATRNLLDLTNQRKVENFIKKKNPKLVIIAAAKVGGILANSRNQVDFIY